MCKKDKAEMDHLSDTGGPTERDDSDTILFHERAFEGNPTEVVAMANSVFDQTTD
jgi:hypothetical protein